jgi:TolB protein
VVNADGTGLRRLTTDPAADFDPSWSPDGRRIAYRHQTGDDSTTEIYLMNSDGSDQQPVTNNSDSDWGPSWSPGGSLILFNSGLDSPFTRCYVINPDGSGLRLLSKHACEYPAWSPDGTHIVFSPGLNVVSLDGSVTTQIRISGIPGEAEFPDWTS